MAPDIEIPRINSREESPAESRLSSSVLLDIVGGASGEQNAESIEGLLSGTASARNRPRLREVLGICMVLVASCIAIYFLYWMRRVLVPLTFAIFLAFLCEPLLALLVNLPRCVGRALQQLGSRRKHRRETSGTKMGRSDQEDTGDSSDADSTLSAAASPISECEGGAARNCCHSCERWLLQIWSIFSVIFVVLSFLAVIFWIFYGVVKVFADFDWGQFKDSEKMEKLKMILSNFGLVHSGLDIDWKQIAAEFRSYLLEMTSSFFSFIEGMMLCVLMFIFCLIGLLPEIHSGRRDSPVKDLVQRYLMCKSVSSFVIAVFVMLALWWMQVPLTIVWGLVTFVTNFIPNLGPLFAIIAPIPFVWLKPDGTLLDTFIVVLVQFLVHNIAGNLIEPQIMSQGLSLHPLIIVVSLLFWSSVWGIAGAILSVPITCVFRLWLSQFDDRRAQRLHKLFDDPMG